jgi:hypothetical protein
VLRVALEGLITQAMVDTGGLYLFCMPSVAWALNLDAGQALGPQTILFRDERVRGTLHRLTLTLLAEEGEDLQLDITAFVPDAGYENVPELPSILSLHGCLERARFAFDPAEEGPQLPQGERALLNGQHHMTIPADHPFHGLRVHLRQVASVPPGHQRLTLFGTPGPLVQGGLHAASFQTSTRRDSIVGYRQFTSSSHPRPWNPI